MPPEHIDGASPSHRRVEQLAESFASGLLMPSWVLSDYDVNSRELASQIARHAEELKVSGSALRWRLVNVGKIPESVAQSLPESELRGSRLEEQSELAPLYSKKFMEILAQGIAAGHISVARTAKLARTNIDELADLFSVHEVSSPFEL
jgi:Zn-dependent peptidase ImmA (M78 family)